MTGGVDWQLAHDDEDQLYRIWCDGCSAEGPPEDQAEEAIAAWNRRSPTPERDATLEDAAELLDLRAQDILLIAGEMSAQEVRSVRAMLNERARAIRSLKSPPRE